MGRGRGSMGKRRGGEQCFRVCVCMCVDALRAR